MNGKCPGVKYEVTIKQIHDVTVTVTVPEGSDTEAICDAAEQAALNCETTPDEYNRTLPKGDWTVRDVATGDYVKNES